MASSGTTKSWIARTRAAGCAAAVLVAALAACTPVPDTTLKLVVDSSDAQVVEETRRILLKRFDDEYPDRVEANVEGSAISVTFKHTSPDRELVRYLYTAAYCSKLVSRACCPGRSQSRFLTRNPRRHERSRSSCGPGATCPPRLPNAPDRSHRTYFARIRIRSL